MVQEANDRLQIAGHPAIYTVRTYSAYDIVAIGPQNLVPRRTRQYKSIRALNTKSMLPVGNVSDIIGPIATILCV